MEHSPLNETLPPALEKTSPQSQTTAESPSAVPSSTAAPSSNVTPSSAPAPAATVAPTSTAPATPPSPPPSSKNWVCQHDDPFRHQRLLPIADEINIKMRPHGTGCVPCLLKNLFRKYWKKYQMDPKDLTKESKPLRFKWDDESLLQFHNLADRWFCRDSEGWPDQLEDEEKRRKTENKIIEKKNKKRERMNNEIEEENRRIEKKNRKRAKKGKEDLPLEELMDLKELWNIPMTDEGKEEF